MRFAKIVDTEGVPHIFNPECVLSVSVGLRKHTAGWLLAGSTIHRVGGGVVQSDMTVDEVNRELTEALSDK
jgi:hypothetical protein